MSDYEIDNDGHCPHCDHNPLHRRDCSCLNCEDGYIDLYDEDPLWYEPGDVERCDECRGTGAVIWCPQCGADPRVKAPDFTSDNVSLH